MKTGCRRANELPNNATGASERVAFKGISQNRGQQNIITITIIIITSHPLIYVENTQVKMFCQLKMNPAL